MREPITLYQMDTQIMSVRDGYEFRPRGRLAWLQRLCWWALVKMRAVGPHYTDEVKVIRLPLDGDGIVERIFQAYRGLHSIREKPSEILVGPETLSEILNSPEVRDYMGPFSFSGRAGFDNTLFNLPVHVLPQMEGVVVR